MPLPIAVPRCGLGSGAGPGLLAISLPLLMSPIALVSRVVGEFLSPPCPIPSFPGTPYPSGVTLEVSPPQGNYSIPGVLMPLGDLTPPHTPLRSHPGFSSTLEASGSPSLIPTPEDSPARFLPPDGNHLPSPLFCPIATSCSRLVRVIEGDIPGVAPAGLCAPWCCFCAASFRFPRRCLQRLADIPRPLAFLASSFVADPPISSPLHFELSYFLSFRSVTSTQYFHSAPMLCCLTCEMSVALFLLLTHSDVVSVAAVFVLTALDSLRKSLLLSLFLYPASLSPLPSSLRLRCTPNLTCSPPPLAPAADIARKDEVLAIGRVGVRQSGRLRADPCRAGSDKTGPSIWWGTTLANPCSCTGLDSNT